VRGLFTRAAAVALIMTVGLGATVAPCAAAEKPTPQKQQASLTRLSPASQAMLTASHPARVAQQTGETTSPSGFFHSKRGAVALVLMGAGAGFTIWSVSHDRKPVKSPIR